MTRSAQPHLTLLRSLLLALGAAALLALAGAATPAGAAPIEWEAAPISVTSPGQIATDAAGRIYVPLRGQGQLNIYDNARGGNKLLASIGQGKLVDPVAVAIDVRNYIYIADAGTNSIVSYSPLFLGAPFLASSGEAGQSLGKFGGISHIYLDYEPRLYVAEPANGRVQSLDVARGVLTPMFAFGVTDPGMWGPVNGLALDSAQRFIVSSSDPSQALRLYSSNGSFAGDVIAGGSAPGQVAAPDGMTFDAVDRLLVADTGNNRINFYSPVAAGLGLISTFGSTGTGSGEFDKPGAIATAPGALLYVADQGNGRIVRLRYDDEDKDGAIDATDNCRGLANLEQGDLDSDGIGDACSGDIDGDGIANAADLCPSARPFVDRNADGCQDPFSTLAKLLKGKGHSRYLRISGRARGGQLGIARVEVALVRKGQARRYKRARGTTSWSLKVRRSSLKRGSYRVYVRAVQRHSGLKERAPKSRTHFRITR